MFGPINVAYRGSILEHAINLPRTRVLVVHASLSDRLAYLDLPHLRTVVVDVRGSLRTDRWHHLEWGVLLRVGASPRTAYAAASAPMT